MGKIWIKSTDPNKQCCGCENRDGPCATCCVSLTGLNPYNMYPNSGSYFRNKLQKMIMTGLLVEQFTSQISPTGAFITTPVQTGSFKLLENDKVLMAVNPSPDYIQNNVYWGWEDRYPTYEDLHNSTTGKSLLSSYGSNGFYQMQLHVFDGEFIEMGVTMGEPYIDITEWLDYNSSNNVPGSIYSGVIQSRFISQGDARNGKFYTQSVSAFGGEISTRIISGRLFEDSYTFDATAIMSGGQTGLFQYYDYVHNLGDGSPCTIVTGGDSMGPDATNPTSLQQICASYPGTERYCRYHWIEGSALFRSQLEGQLPSKSMVSLQSVQSFQEYIYMQNAGYGAGCASIPDPTFIGTNMWVGYTGFLRWQISNISKVSTSIDDGPTVVLTAPVQSMCSVFRCNTSGSLKILSNSGIAQSISGRLRRYSVGE